MSRYRTHGQGFVSGNARTVALAARLRPRGVSTCIIAAASAVSGALIWSAVPGVDHTGEFGSGYPGSPAPTISRQLEPEPQVTLTDLSWQDFHGIALPSSAEDGPREVKDDLAAGFARTPRGGLLAAIHITARANSMWSPRVFETTISRQVTGPDTDALLALTRRGHREETRRLHLSYADAVPAWAAIEGFRWLGYTSEVAGLDLLTAGPGDSDSKVRAVTRIWLVWRGDDEGGDWHVIAPPEGDWRATAKGVDSAAGYTPLASSR